MACFERVSLAATFFKLEAVRHSEGLHDTYDHSRWSFESAESDLRRKALRNSRAIVEGEKQESFGSKPRALLWISGLEESKYLGGTKQIGDEVSVNVLLRTSGLLLMLAPEEWHESVELKKFNLTFYDLNHQKVQFTDVPADALELEVLGQDVHPRLNAEWRAKIRALAQGKPFSLDIIFPSEGRGEHLRLTGDLLVKFMREKSVCGVALDGPVKDSPEL